MNKNIFNITFMMGYIIWLIIACVFVLYFEKGKEILFINQYHNQTLDTFFYYADDIGNGLFYIVVAVLLGFRKLKYSVMALICFAATGILVQFLKNIIFPEMVRPSVFLAEYSLHVVPGIKLLKHYSFPSGHTATAFSMFFLLSYVFRNNIAALIFLLSALVAGFSRMYLLQHFLVDVMAGSIIGIAITYLIIYQIETKKYLSHSLLQKPFQHVF